MTAAPTRAEPLQGLAEWLRHQAGVSQSCQFPNEADMLSRWASAVESLPAAVPVWFAFKHNLGNGKFSWTFHDPEEAKGAYRDTCLEIVPLYSTPPVPAAQAQPECGVDAWCLKPECRKCHPKASATLPQPAQAEFDRDTDGELLIDWSPARGRMLTLSLRADGRLSYAFHWDGEKAHGTAQMPAQTVPQDSGAAPSDAVRQAIERAIYELTHGLDKSGYIPRAISILRAAISAPGVGVQAGSSDEAGKGNSDEAGWAQSVASDVIASADAHLEDHIAASSAAAAGVDSPAEPQPKGGA